MKTAAVLFLLLLAIAQARADELPSAPIPKATLDRRVFFAGIGLLAAAKAADAISTRRLLDRGGWENNPVYGRYPSAGKQAGINLGFFAAQTAVFYLTEKSSHRWVRWTGRMWLSVVIVNHAELAACGSGINPQSPAVQNCHPLLPF